MTRRKAVRSSTRFEADRALMKIEWRESISGGAGIRPRRWRTRHGDSRCSSQATRVPACTSSPGSAGPDPIVPARRSAPHRRPPVPIGAWRHSPISRRRGPSKMFSPRQAKIDFKFNPLTACELRMRVSTNHTPNFHPAETAKVNTLESNRAITTLGSGRTYGFNATIPVSYGLFIDGRASAWYSGRRFGQRC